MMTREQIQEHLSLTKRAVRSTAIELIAKSHLEAHDIIDQLAHELGQKDLDVNMLIIENELAKQPQDNTTGNLIPRKEVGCTFDE